MANSTSETSATLSAAAPSATAGYVRWSICALLFVATTNNYIDRAVISLLQPLLEKQLHWSPMDYATIVVCFQGAYAVGLLMMGGLIDKMGVRLGYAIAVMLWAAAAASHGLVAFLPISMSVMGFCMARVALGIAESANFPAAIKAVSEWFPKKERALATGIFNCGTNVGALTAPFIVPWVALNWGWPWAFCITGALDAAWLVFWFLFYHTPEKHPRLSAAEKAYIQSDPIQPTRKLPWRMFFGKKQTWGFAIVKGLTDPIWWFYLFWVPPFLAKRHYLEITKVGWPMVAIYSAATFGSIYGGWMSSALIKRGWSVNLARKTAMLLFALCVVPVLFAPSFCKFTVDENFLTQVKGTPYTMDKVVPAGGAETREKVTMTLTPEQFAGLQTLSGTTYGSAESFFAATNEKMQIDTKALPSSQVEALQHVLANAARDNTQFWIAVLLIGLAAGAHQGFSANIFTVASDVTPKQGVSSVVGIGGMAGAVGGMAFAQLVGYILKVTNNNYMIPFAIAASAYLTAMVILQLILPRLEVMDLSDLPELEAA